jgi:hypothetical protein
MPTTFVAPGQVRQIVQGWAERLSQFTHTFAYNTSPATPWDLAILNDVYRVDTDGSELSASITDIATSFNVRTTSGNAWTTQAADLPFDVIIGGEVMTVTNVSPDVTFESGVSGWTPNSATFTQSNTRARTGTYSGLLTTTGSPTQAFVRPPTVPVTVGTIYTCSMWVYSVAGYASTIAAIDWSDAGLGYLSGSYITFSVPAAKWTQIISIGAAPASAAFGTFGPTLSANPPTGTAMWIDDVSFTPMTEQTFTVTRSTNGVVKAHSAGAAVWVNNPAVVSL